MSINVYRNESLVQMETYETDPTSADALVTAVRSKWATLREAGLAGDYPIEVLRSQPNGTDKVRVVEVFRWTSAQARLDADRNPAYQAVSQRIADIVAGPGAKEIYTQAVRGFNENFPGTGGVELLKGVCSCLLTVDGMVKDYRMSVKNGIVLMHRSPRMDLDGDGYNEMYLKILMHGGEIIQAALGPIRVEQNFARPNDGMVRSNSKDGNDFPGTAVWRVSWKIQTPMGPLLTDPDQPLIFGPATVNHYPPVGTRFHSPTGPVALIHEETGMRVGTLTPGELTAFDIVVTKDDEIYADVLNTPPADIFEILDEYRARMNGRDAEPVGAAVGGPHED
ncbi:hypothetical protein [Micromonospora sp. NPDC051296]|uniref:hypothetical protein n=1 Tax=Micromonospora sp. NPDC051296 TaxID=3155046 RepID=UPI0034143B6D